MIPTFKEQKENSDKEVSSHLSHVKSSRNSADHETVPAIQPADVLEQFSGTSLRYKCVGLCVFTEKERKVTLADYSKTSELSSHDINWIVLQILRQLMQDWERGLRPF